MKGRRMQGRGVDGREMDRKGAGVRGRGRKDRMRQRYVHRDWNETHTEKDRPWTKENLQGGAKACSPSYRGKVGKDQEAPPENKGHRSL